jgi:transcription elongation GreA/GreB family factor
MDRNKLIKQIINELTEVYQTAISAAKRAHKTATDKDNVAENKYDTFGLEASYLAEGQARRVSQCESDLKQFSELLNDDSSTKSLIEMGTIVILEDESIVKTHFFLGPTAGGLKVIYNEKEILLITVTSPLGSALMGLSKGDEFELIFGSNEKYYRIINIY